MYLRSFYFLFQQNNVPLHMLPSTIFVVPAGAALVLLKSIIMFILHSDATSRSDEIATVFVYLVVVVPMTAVDTLSTYELYKEEGNWTNTILY